jgi:O-antigen biosynthesis protein WbqP
MAKRLLDLLVAATLLVMSAPLLLLAMLAIRLETPGRAWIVQERVGRYGVIFDCCKLRTMVAGTPLVPTHEVSGTMVTAVGRMLRRTGIDELPQLWNVIRGEMSLIGPRPCLPTQRELIELRRRRGVFEERPGISGLAQVLGADMANPATCATMDAIYLARLSTGLDLCLLVLTPVRLLVSKRVMAGLLLRPGREERADGQKGDEQRVGDVVANH